VTLAIILEAGIADLILIGIIIAADRIRGRL